MNISSERSVDMKVINRIMVSSALLVVLSLVSLLAVFGIFLLMDSISGDGGKEMLDSKVFQAEEQLSSLDASKKNWELLNDRLSEYGYNLLVLQGKRILYHSLNDSKSEVNEMIKSFTNINLQNDVLAGRLQDTTFVAKSYESYALYAVKKEVDSSGDSSLLDFWVPFVLISLAVIVVIVLLSQLFTRKMAHRILQPLEALSEGAKRIQNGDLSQPVIYKGNDEFAPVSAAFNHMQEHLLEEQQKNKAYEKARVDLVAGISHDLRTPLTSIKGYIKGLQDGVANTPEKRERYLQIAYQKSSDMDVLLRKLFDFSSMETGNLPLLLEDRDLGDFVRDYVQARKEELVQSMVTISVEMKPGSYPVRIDEEQMNRVMANLFENTIKYANVLPIHLTISVWHEQDQIHLMFSDNGGGVPDDHLPYLFDQFWRGDSARSQKNGESNGLGLYIVKYIVDRHGGTVAATNDNGLHIEMILPSRMERKHEQNINHRR
jgi:signal transduction histidine kinase